MSANFGELSFYSAGFTLPEGDWAVFHTVVLHAFTKASGQKGDERLMVRLDCYALDGSGKNEQYLSMGTKAKLSFMPNPDDGGKTIVPIPGAPAGSLSGNTNWQLYLKSMYDAGLPPGVFTNDLTAIDGIWVHTQNVPEPEERKSFGRAATGENADQQQQQGPQLIPVVTEIKDDGKPWENGGGLPEGYDENGEPINAAPVAPAKPAPKPGPRAVAKPAAAPVKAAPVAAKAPVRRAPAAAPVPANGSGDVDNMEMAIAGAATFLEAKPDGGPRIQLRAAVHQYVEKLHGKDKAKEVTNEVFATDETVLTMLGRHGYTLNGAAVVPA